MVMNAQVNCNFSVEVLRGSWVTKVSEEFMVVMNWGGVLSCERLVVSSEGWKYLELHPILSYNRGILA